MGDFNSQPFSVPIAIMRSHGELSDSFVDAHPYANTSSGRPVSPENGVTLHGMTCDSPLNTYSHGKPIPAEITSKGGKRLDYIFYRQPEVARRRPLIWGYRDEGDDGNVGAGAGAGIRDGVDGALEQGKPLPHSFQRAPVLRCAKSEVVLTGRVPGKPFSYSDHFGLSSTFVVDSPTSTSKPAAIPPSLNHPVTRSNRVETKTLSRLSCPSCPNPKLSTPRPRLLLSQTYPARLRSALAYRPRSHMPPNHP
jgi:sphingomyelin phosphodiesterase 2